MNDLDLREWIAAGWAVAAKVAPTLALILAARWLALRATRAVFRPLIERAEGVGPQHPARLRTLEGLLRSVISYSLLALAAITIIAVFGVDITALAAGAGVVGLALGIGAQRVVRDVLAGFFLLLEDQYQVGEVATLVGSAGLPQFQGTIEEMGLRITRIRDLSGKLVTISNGDIAAVINHSRESVAATIDVGVAPETPLPRVTELLAALPLPEELFAGAAVLQGVAALERERVVLRVRALARPEKAPEAELVLRQLVGEALRGNGVEIR
jgi:small-conductance mechanosensitive channel